MGEHAGGAKIARAFQVAHLLVVEERHIAEAMQLLNVMTKHDARPGVPGLRISHSVEVGAEGIFPCVGLFATEPSCEASDQMTSTPCKSLHARSEEHTF